MKIDSSTVSMKSNRNYGSYTYGETESIDTSKKNAEQYTISPEAKDYVQALKDKEQEASDAKEQNAKENMQKMFMEMSQKSDQVDKLDTTRTKSKDEMKLEILKRMLAALRKGSKINSKDLADMKKIDKTNLSYSSSSQFSFSAALETNTASLSSASGAAGASSVWTKTTVTSVFHSEYENTKFSTQGIAKTSDGRQISFNVDLEMSRSFSAHYQSFTQTDYIKTDPLVINVDSSVASVSDQKFLFDLDSDGKEENISYLNKGSGFLAIDKNNDGTINDGSELFGTKSGDGFADLKEYDKDQNGWIDENDEVFNNLKIWTKNDDGTDRLISLKEAGVGALYLGHASTEFSLNNDSNKTNAVIQSTGVYLKENGQAGTLQHIDLVL